jgi:hypothetical protein
LLVDSEEAIARLGRRLHSSVKEAGLTNHVITETLCKIGITSRRRSGWLGAAASDDAVK